MPGQHQLGLQLSDQLQRIQIVGERVAGRADVQPDRRSDVRQNVVTREQHLGAPVVQADVPRGMTRRPQHLEREAAAGDLLPAVKRPVGERDLDPIEDAHAAEVQPVELFGRCPIQPQPLMHLIQQVVGVNVA